MTTLGADAIFGLLLRIGSGFGAVGSAARSGSRIGLAEPSTRTKRAATRALAAAAGTPALATTLAASCHRSILR